MPSVINAPCPLTPITMSFAKRPRTKTTQSQLRNRSEIDANDEDTEAAPSLSTLAKKVKDKAKKKTSRLSFGDDPAEVSYQTALLSQLTGLSFFISRSLTACFKSRNLISAVNSHWARILREYNAINITCVNLPGCHRLPSNLSQASITPSYSQDYLNELKASTPSGRPRVAESGQYDADMSMDVDDDEPGAPSHGQFL